MNVAGNNILTYARNLLGVFFFLDFNHSWHFWADLQKHPQYQISRKSVQWEPE